MIEFKFGLIFRKKPPLTKSLEGNLISSSYKITLFFKCCVKSIKINSDFLLHSMILYFLYSILHYIYEQY